MEVRLVVQGGQRKVFDLTGQSAVIGRSRGNAVRIPSAEVSRRHCRLRMRDGEVTVEDLDSVNGTFLNGHRVEEREPVSPGDRLEVGPVTFRVEYELSIEPLEPLEPLNFEDAVEPVEELPEALQEVEEGPVLELDLGPEKKQHWSQEDPELVAVAEEEVELELELPDEPGEAVLEGDQIDLLADIEEARTSRQEKGREKRKKG